LVALAAVSSSVCAAPAPLVRDIAPSLYEVVYSPHSDAVFVASARNPDGEGGVVYKLDPATLAVRARIAVPLKPFSLALDEKTDTLYVGHTVDAAVSAIDAATGTLKGTLRHGEVDAEGKPVHVRELAVDARAGLLFVGGVSDGGFLWVIDTATFKTRKILRGGDLPSIGLTPDPAHQRLYVSGTAAYAVIDTRTLATIGTQRIPEKRDDKDGKRRFLVNTALDADGKRLFANQLNNGEGTLVFDTASGKLLQTIATGDMPLGIRFNPARNEVYVASRGSGTFSVIDADSYAIKRSIALPTHPNTIALSKDGKTAWVTVKQASAGRDAPPVDEQVARIDLATP
ncbi:MAG TPA: YncE family protein, partial [Bordetella sp.]